MADIKALQIKVSATGIKQAANDLGLLSKAASQIDPVIRTAQKALDGFSSMSLGSITLQIKSAAEGLTRLRNTTKDFSNIGQSFKGLSGAATSTATAIEKLVGSTAGLSTFNAQLMIMRDTLADIKSTSGAIGGVTRGLSSGNSAGGSGGRPSGSDEDKASAKIRRTMADLERETIYLERGKIGWLEYRAAQLGISDQAAPLIARMNATKNAVAGVGMSAKATANMMRMVPAQFTDIATQLAGGQSPMLILMQQGGQLRDMFGSIGGALKAVGTQLKQYLTNPYVLAALAIAGTVYAMYQSSTAASELSKTLILSGNAIGLNTAQFKELRNEVGRSTGDMSGASEALMAIASSGKIAGQGVSAITAATVAFSNATGTEIDKIVEQYASLAKAPTEGITKLNESYHFLSIATYQQIRALEQQGKTTEATALAQKELARAHKDMASRTLAELEGISWGVEKVKEAYRGWRDTIKGMFSTTDLQKFNIAVDEMQRAQERVNQRRAAGIKISKIEEDNLARLKNNVGALSEAKQAASRESEKDKQAQVTKEQTIAAEQYAMSLSKSLVVKQKTVEIDKQMALIRGKSATDRSSSDDEMLSALAKEKIRLQETLIDKQAAGSVKAISALEAERMALEADIAGIQAKGYAYEKANESQKKLWAIQAEMENKNTPTKSLPALKEQARLLQVNVDLQTSLETLKAGNTEEKKWADAASELSIYTTGLKEQIAQRGASGDATDKYTAKEKLLSQAQDAVINGSTERVRAAAALAVVEGTAAVATEKLAAAQTTEAKAKKDLIALQDKNIQTIDTLNAKYAEEDSAIGKSSAAREQASAVRAVETQRMTDWMAKEREIQALQAQGIEVNKASILIKQQEQAAINAAATEQANIIKNRPALKQLEGPSMGADAKAGFEDYYNGLTTRQQEFQSFYASSTSLMSDSLNTFFTTGKLNGKEFVSSMMGMISKMIAQMLILKAIQMAVGMAGGGDTGTAGQAGNTSLNTTYSAGQFAAGGAFGVAGRITKYANGGALTNGVYSKPTYFANGGTLNVLGEEPGRSEAVMPLMRMSNGDLGVQTVGGSGGDTIQINVTVAAGGETSTTSSGSDAKDAKTIGLALSAKIKEVIVQERRPGGLLAS